MLSRFPDFMYYILDEAPRGFESWVEGLFAVLAACLAIFLVFCLIRRTPSRWLGRLLMLLGSFVFMSVAFGFGYHLLFEQSPKNFKLNAPLDIARDFTPLEAHQQLLDRIQAHREVIAWTLAGLRTKEGERRLNYLASHISGEVRSTYLDSLFLAVVGPPEPISAEEQTTLSMLRGEPQEESRKHIEAEEETLRTRPGLLTPIPGWDQAMGLTVESLMSMRLLLKRFLGGREPVVMTTGDFRTYLTAGDSARLQKFMLESLGVELRTGERVDLQQADDQTNVIEIANEAAMQVAAADWRRLLDFQYFSWTTITLVASGDILPNSTSARLLVVFQIFCGVVMLVFAVGRLLDEPRTARGEGGTIPPSASTD
jgi:Ion channel